MASQRLPARAPRRRQAAALPEHKGHNMSCIRLPLHTQSFSIFTVAVRRARSSPADPVPLVSVQPRRWFAASA